MDSMEKLQFRKGDCVAIAFVIALAVLILLCFLPGNKQPSSQAEIYLHGDLVKTVDLTENQTFDIADRYCNVVRVMDGEISIVASDCPGQDCVHSGSISTMGRVLVCLPNGLEIRVTAAEADVDFVVR